MAAETLAEARPSAGSAGRTICATTARRFDARRSQRCGRRRSRSQRRRLLN